MDRRERAAAVRPADAVEISTWRFADDGRVPNNPTLPVVLMRGAFAAGASANAVRARLEASGWGGTWLWQVFSYHHYHPNAHEALAVVAGEAVLMLGGEEGERVSLTAGDVVVLPAGTGHCQIEASADFEVCGAYPPGQEDFETVRAEGPHGDEVLTRIASVARPATDPAYGAGGPLLDLWG